MHVAVKPLPSSKYRIQFIAKGGHIVHESMEPTATYTFSGSEGYVRARVLESNGRIAWIQPVMISRRSAGRHVRENTFVTLIALATIGGLVHWRTRKSAPQS